MEFQLFLLQQETETDLVLFETRVKIKRDQSFYEDEEDEHVGVRMRSSQMTPTPPLNYSSRGYAASFDDLAMDDMQ